MDIGLGAVTLPNWFLERRFEASSLAFGRLRCLQPADRSDERVAFLSSTI